MENPAYETVYHVGLLDDIHNYFPALLYDQGRFQTLPTVFSYIRHQMNTRFNLYSYGASLSAARSQPSPFVEATIPLRSQRSESDILSSIASVNLLLSLMQPELVSPLRTQGGRDAWAAPVIVSPSREIIEANTEILLGSDLPSGTVCSVCQDAISATESCRKLRVCQHVYHRVCIDQWFSRSVFCPSCRHDIRIRNEGPRLEEPTSPSATRRNIVEVNPADETLFNALGYT